MNLAIFTAILNVLKGMKWYWVVIIFLLAIILVQRACTPKPHNTETVVYQTDTIVVRVNTVSIDTIYTPKPYYIDTGSTKYIVKDIDTAEILKDYFTGFFYQDTILNDSNGLIVISDVLYRNRIKSRKKYLKLSERTIYVTKYVPEDRKIKVFVGFGVGYGWKYYNPQLTADIMLLTKKDNAYSVKYDVFNNSINLTMYWKLRFRKK